MSGAITREEECAAGGRYWTAADRRRANASAVSLALEREQRRKVEEGKDIQRQRVRLGVQQDPALPSLRPEEIPGTDAYQRWYEELGQTRLPDAIGEGDEDPACYICRGDEDLESAGLPESSAMVCRHCNGSYQHQRDLAGAYALEAAEL